LLGLGNKDLYVIIITCHFPSERDVCLLATSEEEKKTEKQRLYCMKISPLRKMLHTMRKTHFPVVQLQFS